MNFDIPPDIAALRERTRQFIAEQVIPLRATRATARTAHPKTCAAN
jgi:acyl-CoA dehydrogenase